MPRSSAGGRQRVPRPAPRRSSPSTPAPLKLLVIVGPTGTGKSEVAVRVAERLDGEIVGCDALQVYRGLDAGTAKPTVEQRRHAPHHLVDVVDAAHAMSLAEYVRRAERAIAEIAARRRLPMVVGGSGLYLRGLLRGVIPAPERDPALRRRLHRMADRFGTQRLHRWLTGLDPQSGWRVPPADRQRIVRGLEIALRGSATWSERLGEYGTWQGGAEAYDSLKIGLDMERQRLHECLRVRVDQFFEGGLVAEVRALLAAGVPPDCNAFKAIGYREVLQAIRQSRDPVSVRADVAHNTLRYSKRQRTWFRKEPGLIWLDAGEPLEMVVGRIVDLWRSSP